MYAKNINLFFSSERFVLFVLSNLPTLFISAIFPSFLDLPTDPRR